MKRETFKVLKLLILKKELKEQTSQPPTILPQPNPIFITASKGCGCGSK